jgi:hypothetical protein
VKEETDIMMKRTIVVAEGLGAQRNFEASGGERVYQ